MCLQLLQPEDFKAKHLTSFNSKDRSDLKNNPFSSLQYIILCNNKYYRLFCESSSLEDILRDAETCLVESSP